MARKKGRDISGWLLVDKPAGVGSTDVVGRVRWALDAKKAGHAGTLDPDATGLLAVALGEATKTVPYLAEALKAYDFTVTWGAETSTDDAAGTVTRTADTRPSAAAIEARSCRCPPPSRPCGSRAPAPTTSPARARRWSLPPARSGSRTSP